MMETRKAFFWMYSKTCSISNSVVSGYFS